MVKAKYGITNEYYQEKKIYGNLEDDQAKINKVFEIFNQEFFDDSLDKPVIFISPEAKVLYKVECPGDWKKEKDGKVDDELMQIILSKGIYEYDTKGFYVLFLQAMIMQYDLEQDKIYDGKKIRRKKLICNKGNYKTKGYYSFCESVGLKVEIVPMTEEEKQKEIERRKKKTKISNKEDERTEKYEEKFEKKIVVAGERFNRVYEDRDIEEIGKLVYSYKKKDENKDKKKKSEQSMRVLECPNCNLTIRVTRRDDVDIRCYNCSKEGMPCNGTMFIKREKKVEV